MALFHSQDAIFAILRCKPVLGRILWIKSSWTAKIGHVNKRKWVWYDSQALDAGTRWFFVQFLVKEQFLQPIQNE